MLKPILELLSSSSEALGFCHRFITGSVPVSFFSSFHSQRIHGSFFFSLFNFQGPSCASRFQSLSALDYLTTFGLICQVLFSTFFAPLAFREVSLSRGLTILPHSARFVKYFFNFFRALTFLWEVSLSGDLTILPHSVWFVKYLFQKVFRLAFRLGCSLGRAWLWYHIAFGLSRGFSKFLKKLFWLPALYKPAP